MAEKIISKIITDEIQEKATNAGVAIDGVRAKDGHLEITKAAVAESPPAGKVIVYADADGVLRTKNEAGTDKALAKDLAPADLKTEAEKPHSALMRNPSGEVSESADLTCAVQLPDGTTAQRPTGAAGLLRFNTDLGKFEGYNGSAWGEIGGGSAGINYITAKDFEAYNTGATTGDWTKSSANITTTITSTAGEILFGSKSLKITSSTDAEYVRLSSIAVDPACVGQGVSYELWTLGLSSYVVGTSKYQFVIRKVSGSNQGPLEYTRVDIPAGTYKIVGNFIPDEAAQYVEEIVKVGTSAQTITIDQAFIGPKTTTVAPSITDWQTYIPTIGGFSSTPTSVFKYRQVGDTIEIVGKVAKGATTYNGAFSFTIPTGMAIDTTKTESTTYADFGTASAEVSGPAGNYHGIVFQSAGSINTCVVYGDSGINQWSGAVSVPVANVNIVSVSVRATIPVVGYGSNVQVLDRAFERWLYNDSTWDSDDTAGTSTKEGLTGGVLGGGSAAALTAANRVKAIKIPGLQPTDRVILELKDDDNDGFTGSFDGMDNSNWTYNAEEADSRGIGIQSVNYTTGIVRVVLGKYSRKIAGTTQNWPAASTGYRWRISVISQGALVGAGPLESRYVKGVTDGSAALTGFVGEYITTGTSIVTPSIANQWYHNSTPITTLTPGVWLIWGDFSFAGNNTANAISCGIATASGDNGTGLLNNPIYINSQNTSASNVAIIPMLTRVLVTTTSTPLYAKALTEDTTGLAITAKMFALRIR